MNIDKMLRKTRKAIESDSYKPESLLSLKIIEKQLLSIQHSENKFSGSDAAKKLSEGVITDINGQTHFVRLNEIDYSDTLLTISLCDAGDWEGREGNETLTMDSIQVITEEIQRILPGVTVDEGETHLADVVFEISLPY